MHSKIILIKTVTGELKKMKSDYIKTIGKVITKSVRKHAWDGAMFPHIVTVEYEVNGQKYTKKEFLNYNITCPNVGSNVDVYYNSENPKKITLNV